MPNNTNPGAAGAATATGEPDEYSTDADVAQASPSRRKRKADAADGGGRLSTHDYYVALNRLGYRFCLNVMTDHIEVNGAPLTDELRAKVRCDLRDMGIQNVMVAEDAWTAHALEHAYHPVKDYLNGLAWDGKLHIVRLCGYFTDAHQDQKKHPNDPSPMFGLYMRRWLVGAVGKIMVGEQNAMLVLDGPQNLGKSSYVRWLASHMPAYFVESAIHPDDKDHQLLLANKVVWECQELGATTRKADIESLKSFITMREIDVRRAYDRYSKKRPAMASIIGTINNSVGFLMDKTGSRRFNVCTLTGCNWDYAKEVNVDQVWAEAVAAWRIGDVGALLPEEALARDELNQNYEVESAIREWLLRFYEIVGDIKDSADHFIPTQQIADRLQTAGYRARDTAQIQREIGIELAAIARTDPRVYKGQRRMDDANKPNYRPVGYYGLIEISPPYTRRESF